MRLAAGFSPRSNWFMSIHQSPLANTKLIDAHTQGTIQMRHSHTPPATFTHSANRLVHHLLGWLTSKCWCSWAVVVRCALNANSQELQKNVCQLICPSIVPLSSVLAQLYYKRRRTCILFWCANNFDRLLELNNGKPFSQNMLSSINGKHDCVLYILASVQIARGVIDKLCIYLWASSIATYYQHTRFGHRVCSGWAFDRNIWRIYVTMPW